MTHEEHKKRHTELHAALDELLGYYLANTSARPSTATVADLIKWSHAQTRVAAEDCCHCKAEEPGGSAG